MNSAGTIDRACRLGQFVYIGNRQGIAGASSHYRGVPAEKGWVWLSVLPDYDWRQVKASDVVITTELLKGDDMKDSADQPDLPGVEQPKVLALERLIKKYQAAKLERMELSKIEKAAKTAVIDKMHELEIPVYKRPGKFPLKAILSPAAESLKVEEIDEDDDQDEGVGDKGEGEDGDD